MVLAPFSELVKFAFLTDVQAYVEVSEVEGLEQIEDEH